MPSLPYWIPVLLSALWLGTGAAVMSIYWARRWVGPTVARWRLRRSGWPRTIVALALVVMASGCATTYRPAPTGPTAFDFVLTPEQCLALNKERRTYRATEQTAGYVAGAGALVSVIALGFVDADAVPVVASSVGLVAGGTLAFTGSQVESLDAELAAGGCER